MKYTTALRLGTAEAEQVLRRFTRGGPKHPTYRARRLTDADRRALSPLF
ncbi:Tn3 family transposase [Streptomyces sp. SAJ15]